DQKIDTHGATPLGADWSCRATQELRFVQLLRIADCTAPMSINDVGCGYGAFAGFVRRRYRPAIDYLGFDVSGRMISEARRLNPLQADRYQVAHRSPRMADYCVASGVFNVKLDCSLPDWRRMIRSTLEDMAANSRLGFAVNFMHAKRARVLAPQLYATYATPWVHFCTQELGMTVEPVAGYGLAEFTLLVRRHSK
ncbi:MAG: class I SAM-dependent methyltransferase, partial [Gammaproteobacteria bacterium]|nr:class I SAM-dependent methyltransferase [Gammaproteobacteria bacterium]